jgi:hypothetical protein
LLQESDLIDSTPLLFLDGPASSYLSLFACPAHCPIETPYYTQTVLKQWSNSSSDS